MEPDKKPYYDDGDPCPKCGEPMQKRGGCFFLREAGSMPGLICTPCNALWASKEWNTALKARAKRLTPR